MCKDHLCSRFAVSLYRGSITAVKLVPRGVTSVTYKDTQKKETLTHRFYRESFDGGSTVKRDRIFCCVHLVRTVHNFCLYKMNTSRR